MAYIDLTSIQLKSIGYFTEMKNFLMYPRQGWHIRLDQKPIGNVGLKHRFTNAAGEETGTYGYRISSFHIKQDNNYAFTSEKEGPYLGKKINVEESEYVYFAYMGGGVWQPIWGYGKYEEKHKGQSIWRPDRSQMSSEVWSFACTNARWFLKRMSKATKVKHGLAMGPVQGEKVNLIGQT